MGKAIRKPPGGISLPASLHTVESGSEDKASKVLAWPLRIQGATFAEKVNISSPKVEIFACIHAMAFLGDVTFCG